MCRDQYDTRLGIDDLGGQVVGGQARIERNTDEAAAHRTVVGDEVLYVVTADQRDPIARRQAVRGHGRGKSEHGTGEIDERKGARGGVLDQSRVLTPAGTKCLEHAGE